MNKSVRSAHDPPPCHCLANTAAQHSYFHVFSKPARQGALKTRVQITLSVVIRFSSSWDVTILIGPFCRSWVFLIPFLGLCCLLYLGILRPASLYFSKCQNRHTVRRSAGLCFYCFMDARFFVRLWFWVLGGVMFASLWLYLLSVGLWEKAKSVIEVDIFSCRRCLFAGLSLWCV